MLRDNIRNGTPALVEWIDLSGHWAIAVGYDYCNLSDPWDDVLILAEPMTITTATVTATPM